MKHPITIMLWALSIFPTWGEVAVIRTSTGAIQSLAAKAEPPTMPESNPFLLLAGPKPPMIQNPINWLIPGAAHDIKKWLKDNAVEIDDKDLALCFWDKDLIVVRSSTKTINSIRELVETETDLYPEIRVILCVREGMDASSKDLCRLETITRSGYKLPVSDVDYEANIELCLADEDLVDTRIDFTGRAELAGKTVSVSFVAKTDEEVKVASWTAHDKSILLTLRVQHIQHEKRGISAAQLIELTQKVTTALDDEAAK